MNWISAFLRSSLLIVSWLLLAASLICRSSLAVETETAVDVMQKVNDKWMQGNSIGNANWARSVYHVGNIAQYRSGYPVRTVAATKVQNPPPKNCCAPGNTIDDDSGTRWSAFGVSKDGKEIALVYDLGHIRPVSHVRISWFRGDKRQAFFELEGSLDNASWESLIPIGESSGTTNEQQVFAFNEKSVRYVKYIGKGNSANKWNSVSEFDISRAKYYERSREWAEKNRWETFGGSSNRRPQGSIGDWIACGQTYIDLYMLSPAMRKSLWIDDINQKVIEFTQSTLHARVCNLPPDSERRLGIRWIDEIFMALPNFSKLGDLSAKTESREVTPQPNLSLLNKEDYWGRMHRDERPVFPTKSGFYGIQSDTDFADTPKDDKPPLSRGLYDANISLWYRDETYKKGCKRDEDKTDAIGLLWSRGNGWVIAGLAQMLETLPVDPGRADRAEYISVFRAMASELKLRQNLSDNMVSKWDETGFWNMDLKPGVESVAFCPETSGTAFFTYALAWGINNGILNAADYLAVVERAWNAMVNVAVQKDGTLGFVQGVGQSPLRCNIKCNNCESPQIPGMDVSFGPRTTADFGVGAFLLAASEMAKLEKGAPGPDPEDRILPIIGVMVPVMQERGPRLIDGDLNTFWNSDGTVDSARITLDLGQLRSIKGIGVAPRANRVYKIAVNIHDQPDVIGDPVLTLSTTRTTTPAMERVTFAEVSGRYVTLSLARGNWIRLAEIEVYGDIDR